MDGSRGVRQVPPEGLWKMAPGLGLAVALAGVDRSRVAAEDLDELVRARRRQVSFDQAELLADLLDTGRSTLAGPGSLARGELDEKYSAEVLSWVLRTEPSYADAQLHLAQSLIDRLPAVYAALRAGELDLDKARAFVDSLSGMADDELARAIADRLLGRAPTWTLGTLRERLRYHVNRKDPAAAERRLKKSLPTRGVALRANDDGTAELAGYRLPPDRAAAAYDRVDRLARAARSQGDGRTLGQLRGDAYLDLLTGTPFQVIPTVDPITADADAACPPDEDNWCVERDPVPAQWFHAGNVEEQPDWWRTASRRRPRGLTPEQCERLAAVSRSETGNVEHTDDSQRDNRERDYGDAAAEVPEPAWWANACTTRPEVNTAGADSRFETGKADDGVLPGDQCQCGRLLPKYHRGTVELQLKLSTLMGLDDDPGLIPGCGPVVADIARQVALDHNDPAWKFSVFDDTTGALLHHGYTRRRPPAKERDFVRARDRSCRTPTCRRPASRTEIEHRLPHTDGGLSHRSNNDCLCTAHHDLKEQDGVTVTRDGTDYTFTLPCGNSYTVGPDKDLILANES